MLPPSITHDQRLTLSRRKGLGDQASEKVTPDSQKSYTQQASETATGLGDKVAGAVQPGKELREEVSCIAYSHILQEGDKSATQKFGDATRSGGDDAQSQGQGILGSAQETLGGLANSASETLQGAGMFPLHCGYSFACANFSLADSLKK